MRQRLRLSDPLLNQATTYSSVEESFSPEGAILEARALTRVTEQGVATNNAAGVTLTLAGVVLEAGDDGIQATRVPFRQRPSDGVLEMPVDVRDSDTPVRFGFLVGSDRSEHDGGNVCVAIRYGEYPGRPVVCTDDQEVVTQLVRKPRDTVTERVIRQLGIGGLGFTPETTRGVFNNVLIAPGSTNANMHTTLSPLEVYSGDPAEWGRHQLIGYSVLPGATRSDQVTLLGAFDVQIIPGQ